MPLPFQLIAWFHYFSLFTPYFYWVLPFIALFIFIYLLAARLWRHFVISIIYAYLHCYYVIIFYLFSLCLRHFLQYFALSIIIVTIFHYFIIYADDAIDAYLLDYASLCLFSFYFRRFSLCWYQVFIIFIIIFSSSHFWRLIFPRVSCLI